jgi:hypothetical protein
MAYISQLTLTFLLSVIQHAQTMQLETISHFKSELQKRSLT